MDIELFFEILSNWGPLVIILIAWLFLWKKLKPTRERNKKYMSDQNRLLETLVSNTDKIVEALQKKEDQ